MTNPTYGVTFKECLHRYGEANYKTIVLARSFVKHAVVGALALGVLIVTAPFYLYPNLTLLPRFTGYICLVSGMLVGWCGGFLLFNNKRFKKLKTKEFEAYATLCELCAVDYIRDSK